MAQHGITANTEERLILDAGAVYRDYGEAGQELIGATRGGAQFIVERDDRNIELDGPKGPVKGLRRTVMHTARLTVTLVEMSQQTFLDIMRGTVVSDGTHRTVTPDSEIVAGDYYTNIALVAEVIDTTTPCILTLLNAMQAGGWTISTEDKDEGELEVTFDAHYATSDLDTPPYTVAWPVNAS